MAKDNVTYSFVDEPTQAEAGYEFVDAPKREWKASDIVREPVAIAADTLAGMANIPIKAAKGIGGLAHFGGQLIRGNGLDAALNKATDFIGDRNPIHGMGSKSMDALGENVIAPTINKTAEILGTDPSNVAAFVEAGGDIATLLGMGWGKGAPTSVAANRLGNFGKQSADTLADRLTAFTLKQPAGMSTAERASNVKAALTGEFLPNTKGVAKLDDAIREMEAQLGMGLSTGQAQGVNGSLNRAIDNVYGLREKALNTADPYGNLNRINEEIIALQNSPRANGANLEMPIGRMQDMKVQQGRDLQRVYGEEKPQFQTTIDKARVRGLKEELEAKLGIAFPELADTNKSLETYYKLKNVLEPAANRIENSNSFLKGIAGKGFLGGAAGGTLFGPEGAAIGTTLGTIVGAAEHPAIAPRFANALHKVNKGKPLQQQAADAIAARVLGPTAGLLSSSTLRDTQY